MPTSIELNSHIRNRLAAYLKGRGMDFQTAMREEKATKKS
ncbi:membrane protein, partial [Neisseria meningitidis]